MIKENLWIEEATAAIEACEDSGTITYVDGAGLIQSLYETIDEDAMNLDTMNRTGNVVTGCKLW